MTRPAALVPLPEPTTYGVVNAAWQWKGDGPLIRFVATFVTVLAVVEARTFGNDPVDVDRILAHPLRAARFRRRRRPGYRDGWRVAQDTTSGARAGTAVAVRRNSRVRLKRVGTWLANRAGSWRASVQTRWGKTAWVIDHGVRTAVIAQHFATVNSGRQDESRRALFRAVNRARRQGTRWIVLTDGNTDIPALARDLGADGWHHDGVMGVMWGEPAIATQEGRGWGEMQPSTLHHEKTDHAVLTVTETARRVGAKGAPW